jgi:hypothetical protein
VAVGAVRADDLDHSSQQLIGELVLATAPIKAGSFRRPHIAADRLSIHPRQSLDPSQTLSGQPQPQDLPDLEHSDLPERHRRLPDPLTGTRRVHPSTHRRWWTRKVVP